MPLGPQWGDQHRRLKLWVGLLRRERLLEGGEF
jgi:hypothetical protein